MRGMDFMDRNTKLECSCNHFAPIPVLLLHCRNMKKHQLGGFEEVVLLAAGILYGNAYTVTLKDEIEKRIGRDVSIGSLQVTLRRLESKGFLKSKHEGAEDAECRKERRGRPRLYFELTA